MGQMCYSTETMRQFPTVNSLSVGDIQGFLQKIQECPVLGHRFKNVPNSRVLNMLNQTLYLLREMVEPSGLIKALEPFLSLHILMHITEEEIDAYFKYFMDECNIEGLEIEKDYWKLINIVKKRLLNLQIDASTSSQENVVMKNHFSVLSTHTTVDSSSTFATLESEDPENHFHKI